MSLHPVDLNSRTSKFDTRPAVGRYVYGPGSGSSVSGK